MTYKVFRSLGATAPGFSFPALLILCAFCWIQSASAAAATKYPTTGTITITQGGTYTGDWTSNDPNTPAVQIRTTAAVTIKSSTISSRGDLISIPVTGSGANVSIQNVTGTALDPQVSGVQRGSFVVAEGVNSLVIKHCSITGARFGVKVLSSSPATLTIQQNLATNLEDRESDGQGGFLTARPDLGHFVMLNEVTTPNGADISWNQLSNTVGQSSTEDVFNIYKSQGVSNAPISVHDNYMEGNSSPAVAQYTGAGLIVDGDTSGPDSAFVTFARNEVVHTAGSGVEVALGHDINVTGNRVVSCGMDSNGNWIAAPYVNAIVVWNYYSDPAFGNITVQTTAGGMLRPDANNKPMIADIWVRPGDTDSTDTIGAQSFTDPCISNGTVTLNAENAERSYWQKKLSSNNIVVGNPNTTN